MSRTPSRGAPSRSFSSVDALRFEREPERIVVVRALFLGDLLCTTPALRALRHRFPSAEITLIGLPWAEDLVRRLPTVDRLLQFPGHPGIPEVEYNAQRTSAFLAKARAMHFDLALQMHGSGNHINGFIEGLGAEVSIGYRLTADGRLTYGLPYVADESEVMRWLRLVGLTGANVNDLRIEFPTTPEEERQAAVLLSEATHGAGPLVGVHAGASTPLRRWPAERFAALADALVGHWGCRIVLTGTAAERELTDRVRRLVRAPVLDLAGRTDLGTFGALIRQLDLLVTNDTGASHLAAAAAVPSVVIFGTTPPHQWAPMDRERHLIVDARTFAAPETAHVDALVRLPVEPVLLACERHFAGW